MTIYQTHSIVTCRGDYRRGFGLDDWIYWHLIHIARDYRQLQRYCWSTHFTVHRCTRIRVLSFQYSYPGNGFITVYHFKSHMESSFRSLIPFLPIVCSCQFRRIDSVQLQAHIPAGRCLGIRLDSTRLCCSGQSQSHIATDGQSVSMSWCRAPDSSTDYAPIKMIDERYSWTCSFLNLVHWFQVQFSLGVWLYGLWSEHYAFPQVQGFIHTAEGVYLSQCISHVLSGERN
jgi:hypothetical protein